MVPAIWLDSVRSVRIALALGLLVGLVNERLITMALADDPRLIVSSVCTALGVTALSGVVLAREPETSRRDANITFTLAACAASLVVSTLTPTSSLTLRLLVQLAVTSLATARFWSPRHASSAKADRRVLSLYQAALHGLGTALGRTAYTTYAIFLGDLVGEHEHVSLWFIQIEHHDSVVKLTYALGMLGFPAGLAYAIRRRSRMLRGTTQLGVHCAGALAAVLVVLGDAWWIRSAGIFAMAVAGFVPQIMQNAERRRQRRAGMSAAKVNSEIEVWVPPGVAIITALVAGVGWMWSWQLASVVVIAPLYLLFGVLWLINPNRPEHEPRTDEESLPIRNVLSRAEAWRLMAMNAFVMAAFSALYTPLTLQLKTQPLLVVIAPLMFAGVGMLARFPAVPTLRNVGSRAAENEYRTATTSLVYALFGCVPLGLASLPASGHLGIDGHGLPAVGMTLLLLVLGFWRIEAMLGGAYIAGKTQSDKRGNPQLVAQAFTFAGAVGSPAGGFAVIPLNWLETVVLGAAFIVAAALCARRHVGHPLAPVACWPDLRGRLEFAVYSHGRELPEGRAAQRKERRTARAGALGHRQEVAFSGVTTVVAEHQTRLAFALRPGESFSVLRDGQEMFSYRHSWWPATRGRRRPGAVLREGFERIRWWRPVPIGDVSHGIAGYVRTRRLHGCRVEYERVDCDVTPFDAEGITVAYRVTIYNRELKHPFVIQPSVRSLAADVLPHEEGWPKAHTRVRRTRSAESLLGFGLTAATLGGLLEVAVAVRGRTPSVLVDVMTDALVLMFSACGLGLAAIGRRRADALCALAGALVLGGTAIATAVRGSLLLASGGLAANGRVLMLTGLIGLAVDLGVLTLLRPAVARTQSGRLVRCQLLADAAAAAATAVAGALIVRFGIVQAEAAAMLLVAAVLLWPLGAFAVSVLEALQEVRTTASALEPSDGALEPILPPIVIELEACAALLRMYDVRYRNLALAHDLGDRPVLAGDIEAPLPPDLEERLRTRFDLQLTVVAPRAD